MTTYEFNNKYLRRAYEIVQDLNNIVGECCKEKDKEYLALCVEIPYVFEGELEPIIVDVAVTIDSSTKGSFDGRIFALSVSDSEMLLENLIKIFSRVKVMYKEFGWVVNGEPDNPDAIGKISLEVSRDLHLNDFENDFREAVLGLDEITVYILQLLENDSE